MTCIVGIMARGKVILGGDSAAFDDSAAAVSVRPGVKVFRLSKGIIAGFAGSFRLGQIVRWQMPELTPEPTEEWMVTAFIPELVTVLREAGLKKNTIAGQMLLGISDQLFIVESDFHVGCCETYQSIGAASGPALGSLYSTEGKQPLVRLRMALDAAAQHNASVRGPFNFEST